MTEDELTLWKRFRQGNEESYEELVLFYLALVKFWARKIAENAWWANQEDLIQDGIIGLIKAFEKFDPQRGNEFTTYARYYIREAIFDSPELTRSLHRRQGEHNRKVRQAHDELAQTLGRKPTVEEIAEKAQITIEQVRKALDAMSIAFPDEFIDYQEPEQASIDRFKHQDDSILIRDLLSRLSDREVLILTLHYRDDLSYLEIGKKLGISEDSVSKICQRARKKLLADYFKQ